MAALRGRTVLFDGDLAADTASGWAYAGSATDVTLFIDDGGAGADWTVEVAVGNGQAGLNGIDSDNADDIPFATLAGRDGSSYTLTGGVFATDLSPFAAQYVRVRPSVDVTGGKASISTVSRNSRSLRGHQVLWNNADVSTDDTSAVGMVGDETNAVLFLFSTGAFDVQVASGDGSPGMNFIPDEADWSTYGLSFGLGANTAIDLSPFGGQYIRLKATADATGVTATLAVTD